MKWLLLVFLIILSVSAFEISNQRAIKEFQAFHQALLSNQAHSYQKSKEISIYKREVNNQTSFEEIKKECELEKEKQPELNAEWYLVMHPNQTMMDVLINQIKQDSQTWYKDPLKTLIKLPLNLVLFVWKVMAGIIMDAGYVLEWVGKALEHPIDKGFHDIKQFISSIGEGVTAAIHLFKENPMKAFLNIFGGFFLHVYLHFAEFASQFILSFLWWNYAVGANLEKLGSVFKNPNIRQALVTMILINDSLDEPVVLLPWLIQSIPKDQSVVKNGTDDSSPGFTVLLELSKPDVKHLNYGCHDGTPYELLSNQTFPNHNQTDLNLATTGDLDLIFDEITKQHFNASDIRTVNVTYACNEDTINRMLPEGDLVLQFKSFLLECCRWGLQPNQTILTRFSEYHLEDQTLLKRTLVKSDFKCSN